MGVVGGVFAVLVQGSAWREEAFVSRKPGDHRCVHCQRMKGLVQSFIVLHPTSTKECIWLQVWKPCLSCPRSAPEAGAA